MKIEKQGYISEKLLLLGTRSICMYLVMGDEYALLGGGVPWDIPDLEAQFDKFKVDRDRIRYIVISHSHHDHCGAVPYLLHKYPHMQTIASPICADVLQKEKPVNSIREVCRKTFKSMKKSQFYNGISLDFCAVPVARQVKDGDLIDLGDGLSLSFYLTPGHTKCSLSTHIPKIDALFPADAIPFPEQGKRELTVTAVYDYSDYISSLEKLSRLPVRLIGLEHGGVLTGNGVETIIPRGLAVTGKQRDNIRNRYNELKDFDQLVEEMTDKYYSLELFRMVPSGLMHLIIKRMVKSALEVV